MHATAVALWAHLEALIAVDEAIAGILIALSATGCAAPVLGDAKAGLAVKGEKDAITFVAVAPDTDVVNTTACATA